MHLVLNNVGQEAAKCTSESHAGIHETDSLSLGELRVPCADIVRQPGQHTGLFVMASSERESDVDMDQRNHNSPQPLPETHAPCVTEEEAR